ncbi:hypothetical protein C8Q80DRAFT_1274761 [Daedaleopsis nitida]|nr:hypothetical protein C8Q80DRAFT_1274761 [Daedaleopsis nitida]
MDSTSHMPIRTAPHSSSRSLTSHPYAHNPQNSTGAVSGRTTATLNTPALQPAQNELGMLPGLGTGSYQSSLSSSNLEINPLTAQHPGAPAGHLDVERLISQHNLDDQRHFICNFRMMSINDKLTYLLIHGLMSETNTSQVLQTQFSIQQRLNKLEKVCVLAWMPSPAQTKLLRGLIRHYIINPIGSYNDIPQLVQDYLMDIEHARKLRLELYHSDMTVRTTVNDMISDATSDIKSDFRKAIFNSCENNVSLKATARNLMDNYYLPVIPDEVPRPILATLALLRKIAAPLVGKKNSRGGDTGFWDDAEDNLEDLYNANGKERTTGPKWGEWENSTIAEDMEKFTGSGGRKRRGRKRGKKAATRAELNAVLGDGIAEHVVNWSLGSVMMQAGEGGSFSEGGKVLELAQTAARTRTPLRSGTSKPSASLSLSPTPELYT